MPLPNTLPWRIVQMVSIVWCVLISVGVTLSCYWLFFKHQSMVGLVIRLGKHQDGDSADLVSMARFGSYAIILASIWMGILSSYVIAGEKRLLTVMFVVFDLLLFACALAFGILGILAKDEVASLTKKVFDDGVTKYTHLKDNAQIRYVNEIRYVVDRVQIEANCCGNAGYTDYKDSFANLTGSNGASACICLLGQCRLQHLPLSCCKCVRDKTMFDPFCVSNVFNHTWPNKCQQTMPSGPTDQKYKTDGCDVAKIKHMRHVKVMFYLGVFDVVVAVLFGVLSVMLILMAWKTSTQKQFVKKEIEKTLKVDSDTASLMVREANEPSVSSVRSGDSVSSQLDGGPQRLSSQRLASNRDVSLGRSESSDRRPPPRFTATPKSTRRK